MINSKSSLKILYYNGSVYTDVSLDLGNFSRDSVNGQLDVNKFLYFGLNKPVKSVYAYVNTASNNDPLILEYYNGTSWLPLEIFDDSKKLTRSGLICWDLPSDQVEHTVNSITKCWFRFRNDANKPFNLNGLGVLFSDDNDIVKEFPQLMDDCYYSPGKTDHILFHAASKEYIMSRLRTLGYVKTGSNGEENINEWDVLDVFELQQASLYYTIGQIFFNLSDNNQDQYWQKYQEYNKKFEEAFALGRLRIDLDNDGQVDEVEKQQIKSYRWNR